ncbi:hypothetical protein B0H10DRAFT_2117318 [Mycena sp. CBHHK59/15]|nr:hypothetical protein B0H10DRAFT_2117318 [Mycena sp. CBHHK59/15]
MSSSLRTTFKRPKTTQACTSCRKHKTRCELLDPATSPARCHRCQVLVLDCFYEHAQAPAAPPSVQMLRPAPPTGGSQTAPPRSRHAFFANFQISMSSSPRLWSFVTEDGHEMEWLTPMLAIRRLGLLSCVNVNMSLNDPAFTNTDISLSNMLPNDRIHCLLDIFNLHYTPWLNFQPIAHSKNPLVDTVCCAIASRHLEGTSGRHLRLRLQKLTHKAIARLACSPPPEPSLEVVQSLLILSLWEQFGGGPDDEGWDGRRLIKTAVEMALELRLNHSSEATEEIRKSAMRDGGQMSTADGLHLAKVSENVRLVLSFRVRSQQYSISHLRLSIGTDHKPLSRRAAKDVSLVQFPRSFEGLMDFRDTRLGIIARLFDLHEEGVTAHLQPGADVMTWHKKIRDKRLITPLPVVLETEQFYFRVLHVYQGICRFLVLHHALIVARINIVLEWGRDLTQTAEALLVNVLSVPPALLGTAPDNVFDMIALAAGYVIGVKFLMLHVHRGTRTLPGASDLLLSKIVAHLHGASYGTGHAPQRCALLVQAMIKKWEAHAPHPAEAHNTSTTPSDYSLHLTSYPTPPSDVPTALPQSLDNSPAPIVPPLPEPFLDVELMFLD